MGINHKHENNKIDNNIDYIVVGSGPGGCATAQALLSNNNKVLMLEAGEDKDADPMISESSNAAMLEEEFYPNYFWVVQQVMQENVDMMGNYSNGRCYGGGSSVNGLQYVRGSASVFNKWYDITKDKDWHPDSIFKMYKGFEKLMPVSTAQLESENLVQGNMQGFKGPVSIRQAPEISTETSKKFVNAAVTALHLPEIADYNDPNSTFGPFKRWQYYEKVDGSRESSSTAILKPILMKDKKFKIKSSATVLRVLFDGKKAIGVEYMKDYKIRRAFAKRGVVLSAGTQTPLILQHSGVGSSEHLEKLGIPVVSDLPNVGENLANHLIISTVFAKDPSDLPSDDKNALYSFGAFYPDPNTCDLTEPRSSEWIGIDMGESMMIVILQANPFSRGYARIQSKDVLTTPLVSEAALDDERDLQFFKDLILNQVIPLAAQLESDTGGSYRMIEPDPGMCTDDEYLTNYIKTHLEHAHHWQSQCIMASKKEGGVVNSDGRVYGTKHLYIADNCIVPACVDNNTAGIAYIIGYTIGKKLNRKDRRHL